MDSAAASARMANSSALVSSEPGWRRPPASSSDGADARLWFSRASMSLKKAAVPLTVFRELLLVRLRSSSCGSSGVVFTDARRGSSGVIHGAAAASLADGREFGSTDSSDFTSAAASLPRASGSGFATFPLHTIRTSACMSSASKGSEDESSAYSTTPHDHMSLLLASYPSVRSPLKSSGAA
eukprot:CAMPEP_0184383262 /NCGR_PEP_ID=MMETSP0007-20130409/6995_1 /TAXON_ID=97485 /ORGANISM="Prymnesium parvum, Strain Texoma1" /LENGTH=181 /DNA_ID=CAMNT_0026729655 /DNA_START=593 /DNA_END=1138 /DNA_ORIENTATION=+